MNIKQSGIMVNKLGKSVLGKIGFSFLLFLFHCASVGASDLAISGIEFATLAGDKLQIQLEMSGAAIAPKTFQTDNPARIALDFPGVKNALNKKMYPVNQGAATSIYIAEAADRVRVVVNLIESTPFETKVVGNKVLLTLTNANNAIVPSKFTPVTEGRVATPSEQSRYSAITTLMPQQAISGFDFKRGNNGEGRILVSLANPNTIVNTKEEGGKVVLSFINTRLPANLAKRLDVSEFATPVKYIEAVTSSRETTVTVTLQNNLYDYSLFQSEGLLTVEFRPLSNAEKEAQQRTRVRYSGERLSLNFQDIEIRSVIAILAEFTGQNVVAGDDVTGTITIKLDDVPWDEALDFIMMTKELGKFETGNVTLISPLDKIKSYKKKQQETEAVVEQLDPLVTEYIKINYAKAEDFRNLLYGKDTRPFGSCGLQKTPTSSSSGSSSNSTSSQGQGSQNQNQNQGSGANNSVGKDERFSLLSSRGSVVVDARTNTLIVRETLKRLEDAKKLIRQLDVPVRQVMIESRIVIASNTFAQDLGVRFGVAKFADTDSALFGMGGEGTQGHMGSSKSVTTDGVTKTVSTPASVDIGETLVDLGASNPYGALGMTLARGADYVLNLELSALQDQGLGELVSNPRVMTSDRCKATIEQGTKVPYTVTSSTGGGAVTSNTQFEDALLQLDVTPQIAPNGAVIMALGITKNELGAIVDNDGRHEINTREVNTHVQVMDGETVVLGGVFEGIQANTTNKVPFFGDLPGIGFLFKRTIKQDDKKELLIFITPKVVKDSLAIN
ncbi:MAG: type IV pilus secretin PilQ [Methylococcaceae bacterium]